MPSFRRFFVEVVGPRLEVPAAEIFVHLVVSLLSILSIKTIELLLWLLGLDGKVIPLTALTLSTWMFILEIIAATVIIVAGIFKAAISAWRGR
jgi:hypothetical protein